MQTYSSKPNNLIPFPYPPTSIHEGRLFVCHIEISQTLTPEAMLLLLLESLWWVGVHQLDSEILIRDQFWPTMEKLLNIEKIIMKIQD
jgi:hypothetical protein